MADPKLKTNAGKAVNDIEGVTAVDNQIQVMNASPGQFILRLRLQRYQLGAVPPIPIIVNNGDVTLL